MNNKPLLIAIACGLLTAFLLLAPLRLGLIGGLLSVFAVLPLFVSALGFGTIAGGISGLIAAAIVAGVIGFLPAVATFCFTLLPAVWVGHMAGLADHDEQGEVWFPLSTILFRIALLCAALVIALGVINGFNVETSSEALAKAYADFYKNMAQQGTNIAVPDDTALAATAKQMIGILPLAMPASLLCMYVMNLSLGARIARKQGWMLRPKDDISSSISLPMIAVGIFAAAIVLTLLGGTIGLVAKVVAGAMGAAFMFVGFAVMHFMTRGVPGRGGILFVAYFVTLVSLFPAFLFAIVGLAETLVGIRSRRTGST